jgi:hypothetical protein
LIGISKNSASAHGETVRKGDRGVLKSGEAHPHGYGLVEVFSIGAYVLAVTVVAIFPTAEIPASHRRRQLPVFPALFSQHESHKLNLSVHRLSKAVERPGVKQPALAHGGAGEPAQHPDLLLEAFGAKFPGRKSAYPA